MFSVILKLYTNVNLNLGVEINKRYYLFNSVRLFKINPTDIEIQLSNVSDYDGSYSVDVYGSLIMHKNLHHFNKNLKYYCIMLLD